ncbi:MAG: J domain-containing protein [Lysobacter sp.]
MTDNRRNYYRVLHVQPEAPLAVIRASYRTLMSTLRQHPDLGGDTAAAALLNEAYAVLRDPQRRAQYDATLVARRRKGAAAPTPHAEPTPVRKPAPKPAPTSEVLEHACPICRAALPAQIRPDTRCARCDAPLAAPPRWDVAANVLFGRRGSARRDRSQLATMSIGWPAVHQPVRWRDISLTGLSVHTQHALPPLQMVRIVCPALDVVAQVVSCRRSGKSFTVHARLVSVIFTQTTGVFVSEKA